MVFSIVRVFSTRTFGMLMEIEKFEYIYLNINNINFIIDKYKLLNIIFI